MQSLIWEEHTLLLLRMLWHGTIRCWASVFALSQEQTSMVKRLQCQRPRLGFHHNNTATRLRNDIKSFGRWYTLADTACMCLPRPCTRFVCMLAIGNQ